MTGQSFSSSGLDQLYKELRSGPEGLSLQVAEEKMKEQAKLQKAESRLQKELRLLIRQFSSPLVLLLVIAVILSALLGEYSDSFIILAILIGTGIMGFWQELNAGRALEKLQKMVAMKHTVLRDGQQLQLSAQQIVPGDMLLLDAGDIIPADCRIITCNELHVNESALTGESYPVEKSPALLPADSSLNEKYNCLWQGTNVISGTASGMVVHTGEQTVFGQLSLSLARTPETAFEKGIRRFGFFLLKITVVLAVVILAANLYFQKTLFDSVLFSLALAVGMAPELLPAIMTFSMSVAAKKMMKKKVIVKKLSSVFNFGEVNVLCTDKTGTITEGKVTVKDIVDINGASGDRIRLYAFLNAAFQKGFNNPIDEAIRSLNIPGNGFEKINEVPYDFIRKRLSIAVKNDQQQLFITKGAFSNVLDVCDFVEAGDGNEQALDEGLRATIRERFIAYSQQGYRVLGLSYKKMETGRLNRSDETAMIFLGFILLEDPLKESAVSSIRRLAQLQVNIKIITGDNRYAAAHVAQQIDMKDPVILTGDEMRKLYPEALVVKAKAANIFAEIEPQQKEQLIKALQQSGLTVAYIGDGINDVAAINAADIGISTDNAVDVAKEAADFVLLEKDLSVLIDGIQEGRKSFANSMKYILITTGATFGNMFSVAGASLFLPFLPMLPKQILLTNFITDLPFLAIASDHVDDAQLTRPGKWNLGMIRRFMIVFGLHSSVFDFITFYTLYFYFHLSGSPFQTGWFLESSVTEIMIIFVMRTRKSFLKSRPGKLLMITSLLAFVITVFLPVSPFASILGLSLAHTQQVIAIAIILVAYMITADILKIFFFRFNEKRLRQITLPLSKKRKT